MFCHFIMSNFYFLVILVLKFKLNENEIFSKLKYFFLFILVNFLFYCNDFFFVVYVLVNNNNSDIAFGSNDASSDWGKKLISDQMH